MGGYSDGQIWSFSHYVTHGQESLGIRGEEIQDPSLRVEDYGATCLNCTKTGGNLENVAVGSCGILLLLSMSLLLLSMENERRGIRKANARH